MFFFYPVEHYKMIYLNLEFYLRTVSIYYLFIIYPSLNIMYKFLVFPTKQNVCIFSHANNPINFSVPHVTH